MASGAHSAIASPNLRYRRLRSGDIGGLVRYRNNAKFLRLYPTETFGDAEADAYLTPLLRWAEEHPPRRFAFAVEPKEEDLLIGVCSLRMAAGESHWAEIGFELDPACWGRGLGLEMAATMVRLGFDDFGLHRLQAHCIADNLASRRVLEKLGFLLEGKFRARHHFKGRYWDELWFGMLASEWKSGGETEKI